MDPAWAAGGAAVGLLAGSAMRGSVFRLSVPRDAPHRTECPRCSGTVQAPVGTVGYWLARRCGRCGAGFGVPFLIEAAAAAVLALIFGRFAGQAELPAFAFLGGLGVLLAAIDLTVHRLPDRLTLPAYPVLLGLLAGAAMVDHDGGALLRAGLGGLAMGGAYLLLALLSPGQLGGGDIKLAGLAGMALGWLGWPAVLAGATLGFLLSAVMIVTLLAVRKITLRSEIAFGPFLLAGVLLSALAVG